MADNEKCPTWAAKSIPLNGSVEMTLDCAVPIKEGSFTGKYGTNNWHLWFGQVENQSVWWKDEKKVEEGYTGKVSFFPTDILNVELIKICNGDEGVKVKLNKNAEEGRAGLITKYSAEKLEGGSKFNRDEDNLMKDLKDIKKGGVEVTEEQVIQMASEIKIDETRAKELFKQL